MRKKTTKKEKNLSALWEKNKYNRSKADFREMTVWQILEKLDGGVFRYAPHQRDDSWIETKINELLRTYCETLTPAGSIELYNLEDQKSEFLFINDGGCRVRAAKRLRDNPLAYGLSKSDSEDILKGIIYRIRVSTVKDHAEALHEYQRINSNLELTPYQHAIGKILYCQGSDKYISMEKIIDYFHLEMMKAYSRLNEKKETPREGGVYYITNLGKLQRHNIALLYRYLNSDKNFTDYGVARKVELGKHYFEKDLVEILQDKTVEEIKQDLEKFISKVRDDISKLEVSWKNIGDFEPNTMCMVTYRWLLDVSFWRRKNNTSPEARQAWKKFIKFILTEFGDRPSYIHNERQYNLGIPSIKVIKELCFDFNLSFYDEVTKKRIHRLKGKDNRPGYHNSHAESFQDNPNSRTVPEPGEYNLSRGSKPMTEEEIKENS